MPVPLPAQLCYPCSTSTIPAPTSRPGGTMTRHVSQQPVVRVRGLRMSYGTQDVLTGVDFDGHRGEVVCLLGRSGAGRTAGIEVREGFRLPSAGGVEVLGADP